MNQKSASQRARGITRRSGRGPRESQGGCHTPGPPRPRQHPGPLRTCATQGGTERPVCHGAAGLRHRKQGLWGNVASGTRRAQVSVRIFLAQPTGRGPWLHSSDRAAAVSRRTARQASRPVPGPQAHALILLTSVSSLPTAVFVQRQPARSC